MFLGKRLRLEHLQDKIVQLVFDHAENALNLLDHATLLELESVLDLLEQAHDIAGLLIVSTKKSFIAGADIKEFDTLFSRPEAALQAHITWVHSLFCRLEDLPMPSVTAINGLALGGGLELALCSSHRVMAQDAKIGLPEVTLGILPGYGGTVRLSRLAGIQIAAEWVCSARPQAADVALAAGVVDTLCPSTDITTCALNALQRLMHHKNSAHDLRQRKFNPLAECAKDDMRALGKTMEKAQNSASRLHQAAALNAIQSMLEGLDSNRDQALQIECKALIKTIKSQAASAMIQTFQSHQALKKLYRQHQEKALNTQTAAVLGAGIMGSGIALSSAAKGIAVRLRDISQTQLDAAMHSVQKQLAHQRQHKKISVEDEQKIIAHIQPQLDYTNFSKSDIVVEAIIENLSIKHATLAELEQQVGEHTIIASNTSSLRIDDIAQALQRKQNFVGMHFFNPVPIMALVEIIKGSQSSDETVSTAVNYAVALGKTPVVVQDCPGFLVNRVLTPYVRAFLDLVADGVDFVHIDRVMENFGWPMGPAYLMDVVGIDTARHVFDIISAGYPDIMPIQQNNALAVMVEQQRFGQKNGIGFYRYDKNPAGKVDRSCAHDSAALLKTIQPAKAQSVSDTEIIERMMLCSMLEAERALHAGVVATPWELDIAMLLGIGYPQYLGGPLKYADWLGLPKLLQLADQYGHLGPQYQASETLRQQAQNKQPFYQKKTEKQT